VRLSTRKGRPSPRGETRFTYWQTIVGQPSFGRFSQRLFAPPPQHRPVVDLVLDVLGIVDPLFPLFSRMLMRSSQALRRETVIRSSSG
jgi:hypothetical protein